MTIDEVLHRLVDGVAGFFDEETKNAAHAAVDAFLDLTGRPTPPVAAPATDAAESAPAAADPGSEAEAPSSDAPASDPGIDVAALSPEQRQALLEQLQSS